MSMIFKITHYLRSVVGYGLSHLAFPLTCVSCGQNAYALPLCNNCKQELINFVVPKDERCSRCGAILISEKETCLECRNIDTEEKPLFKDIDCIFPIHPYILWKKELLFAWKTANNRSLSPLFAHLVFNVLQNQYKDFVIVPVPPRSGKIHKRGWDQIDELCRYLHGIYGIRIEKLLLRTSNEQQKKLNRAERLSHLGKTYVLSAQAVKQKTHLPKRVVLLDDIMTTGVTLETCARALKDGGVECVHAVTLFYC